MKVAVIGAGISGYASYHALRKHLGDTVDVQLYEAYASPRLNGKTSILGAGLGLSPNGINALHSVSPAGAEAVASSGFTHPHITFRNSTGKTLGRFPVGSAERYGFAQRFISREDVHRALELGVPEDIIHWKKRVRAVEEDKGSVRIFFEDGSDTTADLVIGADGVKSVVARAVVGDEMRATYAGSVGVGGFVPIEQLPESMRDDVDADGVIMTFGPDGLFGLARSDPTKTNLMWWSSFESPNPINQGIPLTEIHQRLLDRHSDWEAPYTGPSIFRVVIDIACQSDAKHPVLVLPRYAQNTLPARWGSPSGRIVLIGDAAHSLPSESGQGVSCAVEDAVAYARLCAYFVKAKSDSTLALEQATRAYEQLRRPRVNQVLTAAQRRQSNKRRGKTGELLRDLMMSVLCRAGNRINDRTFGYDVNKEVQLYLDRLEGKVNTQEGSRATGVWAIATIAALAVAATIALRR